ncbi:MAG: hypothetical protein R3E79_04270 [Caldilineaceae bacterium]
MASTCKRGQPHHRRPGADRHRADHNTRVQAVDTGEQQGAYDVTARNPS